jgi:hypothetical protein
MKGLKDVGETWYQEFLDDVTPVPPPEPERVRIPPQTPVPRVLEMQQSLNESVTRYWDAKESSFAYPCEENHQPEHVLSARVALRDPPRFAKRDKGPPVEERAMPNVFFASQPGVTADPYRSRSGTAHSNRHRIDFGEVRRGEKVVKCVKVQNTGTKPMRYNFSIVKHPLLRILTVPGVIMPGLCKEVDVELDAREIGIVDSGIEVRMPDMKENVVLGVQSIWIGVSAAVVQ